MNNVQWYSHHAQELKFSQQHKVINFLEHNCIQYDSIEKVFYCLPIPDYNSRTYLLHNKTVDKSFMCNCQGFLKSFKEKGRGTCSHVGALYEFLAKRNKRGVLNENI